MPYVITTGHLEPALAGHSQRIDPVTARRRAVATLTDAQAYLSGFLEAVLRWPSNPDASRRMADQLWHMGQDGGTVGPLPDGTVIEVALVEWLDLYAALDASSDDFGGGGTAAEPKIIDAYNAAQTTSVR